MLQVQSPYTQLFDLNGDPLNNGYVYIGSVNTNAETNPISIWWDDAGTTPAAQPLRTQNGYIVRNGSPARVFTNANFFSIVVKNKNQEIVFSELDASNLTQVLAQIAVINGEITNIDNDIIAINSSISSINTEISQLKYIDNDLLQQVAVSLNAGSSVTVACFGDSTMWGADPSNLSVQVAIPSPTALQNFVNTFFGNSALTVTNNGISGTTATQMIAGTDGSGSTFAAKMAASSAAVVYCNHGVNDALGVNATTLAQYKTALLSFIEICRQYSKVPVLVTPYPCLTVGTFGSQARAAATARFAETMRDVALKNGVFLIDNHKLLQSYLGIDGVLPLAVLPDGVHGSSTTYGRMGNNLAEAILGAQAPSFSRPNQKITAGGPFTQATSQTFSTDATSKVGVAVSTQVATPQSLRLVFKVEETGMDIYFAGPIFSNGSANITIVLDGLNSYNFSQLIAGFTSVFFHDYETLIARNLEPGFHILIATTSSSGGIGCNYLRSRQSMKPVLLPSGFTVPSQSVLLAPKLTSTSSIADTQFVSSDLPVSRLIDGYEIEWSGQMLKNSGLIVGGNIGTNSALTGCEKAIIFGLNGSGFFTISEATAPNTYAATVLGAVDLSLAIQQYRVSVSPSGAVVVFVNDVQIGTYTITRPYYGGWLGIWKSIAGSSLTITDLCQVYRL